MSAPRLSEADLQRRVIDYARLTGWRVCHVRPARTTTGWRAPVEGDPGLPDLILARDGVVALAELKSDAGRVTTDQAAWLDALGPHGRLWRPADWQALTDELGTLGRGRFPAHGFPGSEETPGVRARLWAAVPPGPTGPAGVVPTPCTACTCPAVASAPMQPARWC